MVYVLQKCTNTCCCTEKNIVISVCLPENDNGLIALSLQTVDNARELIGFGPEMDVNDVVIVFAMDARHLKMQHIIKSVQLAYPNKISGSSKKVCFGIFIFYA